jgi:hypothetical protein
LPAPGNVARRFWHSRRMDASDCDWTRIVVDHIDLHASNYDVIDTLLRRTKPRHVQR